MKPTNKKHITITIDDNLTDKEESAQIAKKLLTRSLSGRGQNDDYKRIGAEVNIKHLETTITIKRVSKDKPIEMVTCNVCGCEYDKSKALYYFHNYGGAKTKRAVCSKGCQDFMIDTFGCRVAKTLNKLAPIFKNHD
jgi:hypothetical protein